MCKLKSAQYVLTESTSDELNTVSKEKEFITNYNDTFCTHILHHKPRHRSYHYFQASNIHCYQHNVKKFRSNTQNRILQKNACEGGQGVIGTRTVRTVKHKTFNYKRHINNIM